MSIEKKKPILSVMQGNALSIKNSSIVAPVVCIKVSGFCMIQEYLHISGFLLMMCG